MSYNAGWDSTPYNTTYGAQGGLGALDIAALQALYGANTTTAQGDDVYELPNANQAGTGWRCIWDTGGIDAISAAASQTDVIIDLRAATLEPHTSGAGGYASYQLDVSGGFTIAKGVVIEDAFGGSGSDYLIGNAVDNDLFGNDGADELAGLDGMDTLHGDKGNDILEGGAGSDKLDGGDGFDAASYAYAKGAVVVDLVDPSQNTGDAKDDIYISIEDVTGSDFADKIFGSDIANILDGGAGNDTIDGRESDDTIDGGTGADVMNGSAGNNVYYVDNIGDSINDAGGIDTVNASISYTISAFIENLTAGGFAAINLTGNDLSNLITGNSAANKLSGGNGNDKLSGGDGDDTLAGGAGKDVLTGGKGKDFFRFDTKPSKTNIDQIVDFNVKDDTVHLARSIFTKLAKKGGLSKAAFWIGPKAHDSDDRIIYDNKKGILSYDADGSGKGAAVQIAALNKSLKMTALDLYVI
nr:calcium-binding protein [Microvirga terricola]